MTNISLDFNRLLGFKVTLRALRAAEGSVEDRITDGGSGTPENYSTILRCRIGVKGVPGLRYRRTS
jgi:hypothetical protein